MATKLRHFYATKDDLLPVIEAFEAKEPVKYVLTGLHRGAELTVYSRGRDIGTLGLPAPHANAISGYNYLVALSTEIIQVQTCPQNSGGVRYAVDQGVNPRTITLLHGAFFAPDVLLYGRVGTVSDEPVAIRLYRAFSGALTKRFHRIQEFWVGPNAAKLLVSGCRLTIGANSPREFDLASETVFPTLPRTARFRPR
jgi:hypothetical protein